MRERLAAACQVLPTHLGIEAIDPNGYQDQAVSPLVVALDDAGKLFRQRGVYEPLAMEGRREVGIGFLLPFPIVAGSQMENVRRRADQASSNRSRPATRAAIFLSATLLWSIQKPQSGWM